MLNRRHFVRLGATGLAAARLLPRLGRAAESRIDSHGRRRAPSLVHKLLSTPVTGFPTITPLFAASFGAGSGPISLVRTETWSDFVFQVGEMAEHFNMVLSCYTTIQSMNRTWFYGAFQPGAGTAFLMQTADPNEFQQAFTSNQGTMNLVDFNICWQLGQLMYSGYWLTSGAPKNQTLVWDLIFNDLVNQWKSLSASNNRMTRIQA